MKKVSRKTMALSHENLSDEKMVGALGSITKRKVSEVIYVKKVSRITMAWRMVAITVVLTAAFIGLCSEPIGTVDTRWWIVFWTSKIIGAAFAVLAIYLYKEWDIKKIVELEK